MRFTILEGPFAICRLDATAVVPHWATRGAFSSVTRTPKELSMICEEVNVPPGMDIKAERGFRCIQLEGPFGFEAVGILESVLAPLAHASVPIFAVSTYDTDWVLIQAKHWQTALSVLTAAGHELVSSTPAP